MYIIHICSKWLEVMRAHYRPPSAINMPIQFHIGELKNVMASNRWETIRKWPIPAEFQCFFMIGTRHRST